MKPCHHCTRFGGKGTQDRQIIGKNNNDKFLLSEAVTKFGYKRTHHGETTITSFLPEGFVVVYKLVIL